MSCLCGVFCKSLHSVVSDMLCNIPTFWEIGLNLNPTTLSTILSSQESLSGKLAPLCRRGAWLPVKPSYDTTERLLRQRKIIQLQAASCPFKKWVVPWITWSHYTQWQTSIYKSGSNRFRSYVSLYKLKKHSFALYIRHFTQQLVDCPIATTFCGFLRAFCSFPANNMVKSKVRFLFEFFFFFKSAHQVYGGNLRQTSGCVWYFCIRGASSFLSNITAMAFASERPVRASIHST